MKALLNCASFSSGGIRAIKNPSRVVEQTCDCPPRQCAEREGFLKFFDRASTTAHDVFLYEFISFSRFFQIRIDYIQINKHIKTLYHVYLIVLDDLLANDVNRILLLSMEPALLR